MHMHMHVHDMCMWDTSDALITIPSLPSNHLTTSPPHHLTILSPHHVTTTIPHQAATTTTAATLIGGGVPEGGFDLGAYLGLCAKSPDGPVPSQGGTVPLRLLS